MSTEEEMEKAKKDLLIYGIMVIRRTEDGGVERVYPPDILIDFPEVVEL